MAVATKLGAGGSYEQHYWVTVSDPLTPLYPSYSMLIDSGGEELDGVAGPLTTTYAVPSLLLSARAQTDIGLHKAATAAIGISRANAPSVLIPSQRPDPVPIFTQARVASWTRVLRASSSVTANFTVMATQCAQANLYAATNLGIRLSLSDAPNNW